MKAVQLGALAAAACGVAYHTRVLPQMRSWGTTPDEARGTLPGDELSRHPVISTHAIAINAPPEAVWPWLIQIGEGRGGFYSHDWIERLMLGGRYVEGHSATRVHPDLQEIHIGDKIRLAEPAFTGIPVSVLDRPHHFGVGPDWHFILRQTPQGTRLVVRMRGAGWLKAIFRNRILLAVAGAIDYAAGEPLHYLMERGMLEGVRKRAEAAWGVEQQTAKDALAV